MSASQSQIGLNLPAVSAFARYSPIFPKMIAGRIKRRNLVAARRFLSSLSAARSDSNADGVGDIRGIIGRLPYLQALGIDAVWLSRSFFPDGRFRLRHFRLYRRRSLFGAMEDFDALEKTAHDGGLKIIPDLVPNHTSDQHPWFSSKAAARAITASATGISGASRPRRWAPNNWMSEFAAAPGNTTPPRSNIITRLPGPEPDLNWRNRQVRRAIHDVMPVLAAERGRRLPRRC